MELILNIFCWGSCEAPTHSNINRKHNFCPLSNCYLMLILSALTPTWKLVLLVAVNSLSIFSMLITKVGFVFLFWECFKMAAGQKISVSTQWWWAESATRCHCIFKQMALKNISVKASSQAQISVVSFCGIYGVSNKAISHLNTFVLFTFGNLFCLIQPIAWWAGAYSVEMVLFVMQYWSFLHLGRCEN